MNKLSAVLIVRDEENNIKNCLESIKWVDEIILVDQSSTDRTVDIAKEYTDKIFVTKPKGICNPDRKFGISHAKNDWILLIEADERISLGLKKEIIAAINNPFSGESYKIPVKTFFLNKWIKSCGWYPSYVLRLFKKDSVIFPPELHSNGMPKGRTEYLKNDLLHFSYNSISDWIKKFDRYTSRWALEQRSKDNFIKKKNFLYSFVLKPLYYFLYKYVYLKGFTDGFRGFFISFSSSLTVFFGYAKLLESQIKDRNKKENC